MDCRLDRASLRLEFFILHSTAISNKEKNEKNWWFDLAWFLCNVCEIVVKKALIKIFFDMGQVALNIDRNQSQNWQSAKF